MINFNDIKDGFTELQKLTKDIESLELQKIIFNLEKQVFELEKENLALKQALSKQQEHNLIIERGHYWDVKEDGTRDGPYCIVCYDDEKKLIHKTLEYACPKCGNHGLYTKY